MGNAIVLLKCKEKLCRNRLDGMCIHTHHSRLPQLQRQYELQIIIFEAVIYPHSQSLFEWASH